jgi:predicted PurR-regulated permease PerM
MDFIQRIQTWWARVAPKQTSVDPSTPPKGKQSPSAYWFTLLLVFFIGYWLFVVLRPYLSLLALALILAVLFDPVYKWLLARLHNAGVAALVATFVVFLVFIIPILGVLAIAAQQAISFAGQVVSMIDRGEISVDVLRARLDQWIDRLPPAWQADQFFASYDLPSMLRNLSGNVLNFTSSRVLGLLRDSTQMLANLVLFFFILMYWFQAKDPFFKRLVAVSPLADEDDRLFLKRFQTTASSLIKGNVLIAAAQGAAGWLIFLFLGIPSALFWGLMMGVASFIPLGSGIIWIPAAVILLLIGRWVDAVILLVYGNLVIGMVDNIIRAKLLEGKRDASLPPLLTLASVLGGIQVFGFLGFLYGPIIAMLFLTAVRLYENHRSRQAR